MSSSFFFYVRYGATPLHHASASDFKEVAEILLQAGANPNVEDIGGTTPLGQAVLWAAPSCIPVLIKYGAEIA